MIYDYINFNQLKAIDDLKPYIIRHPEEPRVKFSVGYMKEGRLHTLSTKGTINNMLKIEKDDIQLDMLVFTKRLTANNLFIQLETLDFQGKL